MRPQRHPMVRIQGAVRPYAWGSVDRIPDFLGRPGDGSPVAELWFGAHPEAHATVRSCTPDLSPDDDARAADPTLDDHIAGDPGYMLGADVVGRYGEQLPYLLKLIAPAQALSLQVHPDLDRARRGYAQEEAVGVPRGAFDRSYRDPNHKPEMVYALTRFEAVCGFRAPRRALEVVAGLGTDVTRAMEESLREDPSASGVRAVVENLLREETRPTPEQVAQVAAACAARLAGGASPSRRVDRIVSQLAGEHPGDPGVVVALLLNPVTLQPGEAMFVPAGMVHAYLSGFAVEIMASSDNVLRAGLTSKHIDVPELLDTLDYVAAPPVRIAAEQVDDRVAVFYAPVDDFELAVVSVGAEESGGEDGDLGDATGAVRGAAAGSGAGRGGAGGEGADRGAVAGGDVGVGPGAARRATANIPGRGPRILLAVEGSVAVSVDGSTAELAQGEAVFVAGACGPVTATGAGRLVQADVP